MSPDNVGQQRCGTNLSATPSVIGWLTRSCGRIYRLHSLGSVKSDTECCRLSSANQTNVHCCNQPDPPHRPANHIKADSHVIKQEHVSVLEVQQHLPCEI